MDSSRVVLLAQALLDPIGPRLTGSPGLMRKLGLTHRSELVRLR